ncbi:hypothetical protein NEMBOFW57_009255 [Staphylotrichum longicolle]|uniref:Sialidase domain-containing protein n=1 Tax=Staphylotrichum longicolle TaxID=669026 RepID=A0AAD4ESJ6_9PEZI|nr:hypothetical protein NEMBOFW57_009255 [Staphylotrichum longicolle]
MLITLCLAILFLHSPFTTNQPIRHDLNNRTLSTHCNFDQPIMDVTARQLHIAADEHFIHDVPGTYPRLCRLSDGSILAGFTTFEPDGTHILSVARSDDGGSTFQPHGEVARSPGDCDNLFLLELPDMGTDLPTVLAAFRNHDLDEEGKPTYFRITVCESRDGGQSWNFLSQAFEKEAPFGLWEPFLRVARESGEVHLFFSQEMDVDDQDTMVARSADGGATWSTPVCVTGEGEKLRDGSVGVAESCDPVSRSEALVLVMETTRRGKFSIEAVVSLDGGETFGSRHVVYEPREGRNAGAPQIAAFADGSLAVVFMTDEDGEDEPIWPRGASIKAVYGSWLEDGTISWSVPEAIADAGSSWPGIMSYECDAALAVYESSSSIRGRMLRMLIRD